MGLKFVEDQNCVCIHAVCCVPLVIDTDMAHSRCSGSKVHFEAVSSQSDGREVSLGAIKTEKPHTIDWESLILKRNKIESFVETWMDLEFCHTVWNKSEREKQTLYNIAYIWALEKWYRWTYLQGRNRDAVTGNRHVDTEEGKWVGRIGRLGLT